MDGRGAAIPAVILTPVAGAVADRFDRRKVMFTADAVSALVLLAALPAVGSAAEMPVVYLAVLAHARAETIARGKVWIPGWTGMMRERQAASCIAATRAHFEELRDKRSSDLEIEAFSADAIVTTFEGYQLPSTVTVTSCGRPVDAFPTPAALVDWTTGVVVALKCRFAG